MSPTLAILCLSSAVLAREPLPEPSVRPVGRATVLHIVLQPTATVKEACIYLRDVATLQGATMSLTKQVANLDLADAPAPGASLGLSKEEIAFRLELAGVDAKVFCLEGAKQVTVRTARRDQVQSPPGNGLPSSLTEAQLERLARAYLLRHLPWPTEDVHIQLAQPIALPAVRRSEGDSVTLEPELRSSGSLLGRVFVDITVLVNGRPSSVVPVALEIKLSQQLAVARRRIEAGEVLGQDNLYPDRRVVRDLGQYLTYAECLNGKHARSIIPAGQLVGRGVVEAGTDHPILVKQRDLVKLMARVGPLRVVALGEALQDGGCGQTIRVRNVDSKSIILGRVVDHTLVEVDY